MTEESITPIGAPSRSHWIRLRTLVVLRWIAITGQLVTITVAQTVFELQLPLVMCYFAVGAATVSNILATFAFPENKRLNEGEVVSMLTFDIAQLCFLLYLTGGLNNPFALLVLAPVTISASVLRLRSTLVLGATAVTLITLIGFFHLPLRTKEGFIMELPVDFLFGFWVAILTGLAFIAGYARRISAEINAMSDALLATQMALVREQKLTDLGGVVAAAAHELGTPLATIKLVSSELAGELDDPDLREDARLIREQADRCRDILRSMGRAGKDDKHMQYAPLDTVIREAAEPHLQRGKEIHFQVAPAPGGDPEQPLIRRQPEIIHGLRNLAQNAVDFAERNVWITASWTDDTIRITKAPSCSARTAIRNQNDAVSAEKAIVAPGGPSLRIKIAGKTVEDLAVCGEVAVAQSDVEVDIGYGPTPNGSGNEATFDVQAKLDFAGWKLGDGRVEGTMTHCTARANGCSNNIDVTFSANERLLGLDASFGGGLDYERGELRHVDLGFSVRGDVLGLASANVGFDFEYDHDYRRKATPTDPNPRAFDRTKVTYDFGACIFFGCFEFHGIVYETNRTFRPPKRPVVVSPPEVLMNALEAVSWYRTGGPNCETYRYASSNKGDQPDAFDSKGFPRRYTEVTNATRCNYYFHFVGQDVDISGDQNGGLAKGVSSGELYLCLNQNPTRPGNPNIRALTDDAKDPAGTDPCFDGNARFHTNTSRSIDVNDPNAALIDEAAGAAGSVYITSAQNMNLGSIPQPKAKYVNTAPTSYTTKAVTAARDLAVRGARRPLRAAGKGLHQGSDTPPFPPQDTLFASLDVGEPFRQGTDRFAPLVVSNFTGDPLTVTALPIACVRPGRDDTQGAVTSWAATWNRYQPGAWRQGQSTRVPAGTDPVTNSAVASMSVVGGSAPDPIQTLWAYTALYVGNGDPGASNLQVLGGLWSTLWFLTGRDLRTPVNGYLLNPRPDYQLPFTTTSQTNAGAACNDGNGWLYLQTTDANPSGTRGAGFAASIVRMANYKVEQLIPLTVEQPAGGDEYVCMFNTAPGYDLPHWRHQGTFPFTWRQTQWSLDGSYDNETTAPSSSPPPGRGPLAPPTGTSSFFGLESTSYRFADPTLYPTQPGGVQVTVGLQKGDPNQVTVSSGGSTCSSDPGVAAGAWRG